jgi:hypothetical protein
MLWGDGAVGRAGGAAAVRRDRPDHHITEAMAWMRASSPSHGCRSVRATTCISRDGSACSRRRCSATPSHTAPGRPRYLHPPAAAAVTHHWVAVVADP